MSCDAGCQGRSGCDHRKSSMFTTIDGALARLYPSRRWGERDDGCLTAPAAAALGERFADAAAARLRTMALWRPGATEEYCDYVYVLCLGRQPSILEAREGLLSPAACWDGHQEGTGAGLEELHLRVALSSLGPLAAVQQVVLRMIRAGSDFVITEVPRTGVFDPVLLARFRKVVFLLTELGLCHLDFGDMTHAPEGFDAGPYRGLYGGQPSIANYLFYPQPCAAITTTLHRPHINGGRAADIG